ncbi:MAG: metallophosphoesterase [Halobacteriota archaeon]|uniref:metallophosphoesterase n=1 Tax=Natronomonas sp. TaxID=2184060 RepID=UPI00397604D7
MQFDSRDRAAYLPATGTLVCADLHIGRDATSDVEFRVGEHEDLTARFGALLERYEPKVVVVAGDLLHSFDRIPTGAAATVRALVGLATDANLRLVVTPGNHDTMLEELWDGPIEAEHLVEGSADADESVVITHGHVEPETDAEWYVVGHDHPTIEIEGVRRPCYLYGPDQYHGAGVLMLPSFSRLPAGIRVNGLSASEFQSPLVTDVGSLRPIVHDEGNHTTHEFPPLRRLRRFL